MMIGRIAILLSISLMTLLCSCGERHRETKNEIHKIVFATGGCFGTCPIETIEIDSSLKVKYMGVKYTERQGCFIGKISKGFWDTINKKLETIHFKQLDSSYQHSIDDQSSELYIYYSKKIKHVRAQQSSLPDSIIGFYNWFMKSYRQLPLQQTTDSLMFVTIIGRPMPPPPYPPNANQRFAPRNEEANTLVISTTKQQSPHRYRSLSDTSFTVGDIIPLHLDYQLGKCGLRPESVDSFQTVALFLKNNPKLIVEIGNHTDKNCETCSQRLTLCRARSCYETLIKIGVDSARISFRGYSDRYPFILDHDLILPSAKTLKKGTVIAESLWSKFVSNKADYELLRSMNRRTELKITSN
jgi:outer membrane protein OmpA-like peptidoglycan-associated protein